MRYRLLGLLLLITLSACQTTKVTPEKTHGAYYVGGRLSQEGPRHQFASDTEKIFKHRDLPNTTLLIYNHGTISSGIHQTCRTDWMPKYVRQLTYKDPSIVAYYFCSQESGGNSGDSIVNQVHYKRGIEIAELSDKFQELGIQKDNIFLMGHSGGASSSLMAASRTPEKFNSYIVTAPGYGYAYLGGAGQGVNYDALYDNWKTLIQRGKKSKGIVYGFPGDKYSPAKDLDFMKSMKNIDYRVLSNKDDPGCGYKDVHAYPWTKCFEKGQTQNILSYIQRNRSQYTVLQAKRKNVHAKSPADETVYSEDPIKNKQMALLKIGCDRGSIGNCHVLGLIYKNGSGVEPNYEKAFMLFEKSCSRGSHSSCNKLGEMYEEGKGVDQNFTKAKALYKKACDDGNKWSCKRSRKMIL